MTTTILLDDCASSSGNRTSSLLQNPIEHLKAEKTSEVELVLKSIQSQQDLGRHVVALFSYELGEFLQGLKPKQSKTPFLEAFIFDQCIKLSNEEVSDWIQKEIDVAEKPEDPAGVLDLQYSVSQASYTKAIDEIHHRISQGETYQVNYTMRLAGAFYGLPIKLYQTLRQRQPVRFGAFITGKERKVMCFSPELYIAKDKNYITAKPMKGTLGVSEGPAQALSSSPKERAENLMITDLIRNDLGRICKTGSITVPELFQVQQVGQVHQMTSTVVGEIRDDVTFSEILRASFPCGSINGAPKKRTMEIIQELESSPRGLYCGSIGYFEPGGNFLLNVAIRTLELFRENRFEMGVGSGITIDSNPKKEWQECQTKAKFIKELRQTLGLIETMRYENGEIPLLQAHLNRLERSANTLRIKCKQKLIRERIERFLTEAFRNTETRLSGADRRDEVYAVRLDLRPDGEISLSKSRVEPMSQQKAFWAADLIGAGTAVMNSQNPLLQHKTTSRRLYDQAWQSAREKGGFDGIFTNERGEITEGGRSNIFAKIKGVWLTPPLSSGVLPGIMRDRLLRDKAWDTYESVLFPKDLIGAEKMVLVNALRGIIEIDPVFLLKEPYKTKDLKNGIPT